MGRLEVWRKLGFWVLLLALVGCGGNGETAVSPPNAASEASNPAVPTATVLVDGLLNPVGVEPLPDGSLLIAEEGTGEKDDSAGVTLLLANGRSARLISNLPSGRDSGDLSGVPFARWRDGIVYTSHFNRGHLLTLPLDPSAGLTLPDTPYTPADLGQVMLPLNAVQLHNPFDLVFDENGRFIVTDATENGVATLTESGQTRFFHRFPLLNNPGDGKPTIDPVPTGIERVGSEFYVTLTSGCPYPDGGGQLVAIDMNRSQRTVLGGLNMPIDVVQAADGTIWLLEFAHFATDGSCFSGQGYLPNSGRLSYLQPDGTLQTVLVDLNFPGSFAFDRDGHLIVSEIFSGRVLKVTNPMLLAPSTSVAKLLGEEIAPMGNETNEEAEVVASLVETAVSAPSAPPDIQFVNVAQQVGLDFQHRAFINAISEDPAAMMGAGLCWIDYNRDGWLDLYLVNSYALAEQEYLYSPGGLPYNRLYQNNQGVFTDVSLISGTALSVRGNGCIAADLNGDGWDDLYVTVDGPNALLWNQGNGTFLEGARLAGVDAPEWNSAASAGDLNGDGYADLFVAAYIDLEKMVENPVGAFPQDFYGLPDHLYLNNCDGTFSPVTEAVGLLREERGLGSLMSDFDNDGDLDLYIANDGHPNRMYLNEPATNSAGFQFVDVSQEAGTNDSGSGMGVAGGDYDNNGRFDLLVTNWDTELNALYRNQMDETGNLTFLYSTFRVGISGLGNNMTGWGTAWADFDHDADEDLLVVNGHVPITDLAADAELVRLYGNRLSEGEPGQLREWTQLVGLGQDGLGPLMARGSAVADYDNDGDLDVAINTVGGTAVLLQNQRLSGNWLQIATADFQPGLKAIVTLPDGRQLVRERHVGSSYLASEDPRLHFGLGNATLVSSVEIIWPNGTITQLTDVAANQTLVVYPK